MSTNLLKIAVLISGGGRSLQNLIDGMSKGELPIEIACVISSRRSAGGIERARVAGIPTRLIRRRDFASPDAHCEAVFSICREQNVDLVVMAGYLQHLLIPVDFEQRVINIHPALIPKFCGAGFYGDRVHQAVLASGDTETGCTVHYVDNEYDHGPIILQRRVPVHPHDTVEELAARVFQQECAALPAAIRAIVKRHLATGAVDSDQDDAED